MQLEREKITQLVHDLDRELRDPPAPRPPTPSTRALNARIQEVVLKLSDAYAAFRQDQRKFAIYSYLRLVYAFGQIFEKKGQSRYVMERVAGAGGPKAQKHTGIFAYLLRATSTANRKTRSKWANALEIANRQDVLALDLESEIRRAGGLNEFIRARTSSGDDHSDWPKDDDDEDDGWGDDADFEMDRPVEQKVNHKAPAGVRIALTEASNCFDVDAFTATVVMCSLALHRACAAHGIQTAEFGASLDALRDRRVNDPGLIEPLRGNIVRIVEIAYAGKAAVHRKEARELLVFAHKITDALFA